MPPHTVVTQPWSTFSDDDLLEIIVGLRSSTQCIDEQDHQRLVGSASGEAIRRGLVWPQDG